MGARETPAGAVGTATFWGILKAQDYSFWSGVPCSTLGAIIAAAERDPALTYVPAVREEVALGIASGAALAGRRAGVLLQNSGLGNIVNGLTSFTLLYRIPVALVISWRGHDGHDAPEHLLMGAKTSAMLDLLGIPHTLVDGADPEVLARWIADRSAGDAPFALLVREALPS